MRIFEPVLAGMFAVPLTLFFPLFVVFFGIGPDSKVAYGAIYSFFPIALNTIAGFSGVDELYLRSVRSMGASSLQQFRYVYLPAAMPVTLTALRIGFFICIASVLGGVTLIELSIAFAMSVVFGMLIGVLIGLSNIGRRSLYPMVLMLYGIPQAILLPLFVLVFGLGPASKIAFGFSHGIFPVIVNTIAGMRNVSPLLVGGAAAMGATRAQQVRYVIFPHMVTAVFAGLALAMTLTLLGG